MNYFLQRFFKQLLGLLALALWSAAAGAHGFKVGDILIEHPYATPTLPGSPNGALYLRALKNTGSQPDRLLSASTPVAAAVEIHSMVMDANNVMKMRQADALPLPAGQSVELKHGGSGSWHLMLMNLKSPLQAGQRFTVTLRFERAGSQEVQVWVQQPKEVGEHASHAH